MTNSSYSPPVPDNVTPSIEGAAPQITTGVVTNCRQLNIRQKPLFPDSKVVAVANALDKLEIDIESSTDEWIAVKTSLGVKGFCLKQFVAING